MQMEIKVPLLIENIGAAKLDEASMKKMKTSAVYEVTLKAIMTKDDVVSLVLGSKEHKIVATVALDDQNVVSEIKVEQ